MSSFRVNSRGHLFYTNQFGSVKLRDYSLSKGQKNSSYTFSLATSKVDLCIKRPNIISKMSIKRGDQIISEKPFVYAVKFKYRKQRCDYCLKQTEVLKCSRCCTVYYCDEVCQKKGWKIHEKECLMLKKVFPKDIPDAARMILRLILRLDNGGDKERYYYSKTKYRQFRSLESHYHSIMEDDKRTQHFESLYGVIGDILQGSKVSIPSKVVLMILYGRFVINGFNILDAEMNSIATGVYLGISVIDHSCQPNAVATFEGTTLNLYAIEDMESLDWEKIRISYIDVLNPTVDRRRDLKENYYFLCNCEKCLDINESFEMNAAKCPNRNCTAAINIQHENCHKCSSFVSKEYRNLFQDVITFTKYHLKEMKEMNYLDVCQVCLNRQSPVVHRLNIWHVKTLDAAFETCITLGKWTEAIEYGIQLIPGFRKYYGNFNPLLGLLFLKLGKLQLYVDMFADSIRNLKLAEDILMVTHGANHSLLCDQLRPILVEALKFASSRII